MVNRYRQLAFIIFFSSEIISSGIVANPSKVENQSPEKTLQIIVENEVYLNDLCVVKPQRIIAILANPRTGRIVAIASRKSGKPLTPVNAYKDANSFEYNPGAVIDVLSQDTRIIAGLESSVTPLQMVMAYCAIANGGLQLKPSFGSDSKNRDFSHIRILSQKDAITLQNSLQQNVMGSDSCLLARVKGMEVAGIAGQNKLNHWFGITSSTTASFIGFFPAEHPEYVCLIIVQDAHVLPKFNRGSWVAAPCFSSIAEKTNYLAKKTVRHFSIK